MSDLAEYILTETANFRDEAHLLMVEFARKQDVAQYKYYGAVYGTLKNYAEIALPGMIRDFKKAAMSDIQAKDLSGGPRALHVFNVSRNAIHTSCAKGYYKRFCMVDRCTWIKGECPYHEEPIIRHDGRCFVCMERCEHPGIVPLTERITCGPGCAKIVADEWMPKKHDPRKYPPCFECGNLSHLHSNIGRTNEPLRPICNDCYKIEDTKRNPSCDSCGTFDVLLGLQFLVSSLSRKVSLCGTCYNKSQRQYPGCGPKVVQE